jgi:transketolase
VALSRSRTPTCLILSRQALPTVDRASHGAASGLARGGYILADAPNGDPQVILIATGAEVGLCLSAHEALLAEGVACRVVSMPSFALFEAQDIAYRRAVLPPAVTARVAVEAASPLGWDRYAGAEGEIIAMRAFGASGPIGDLMTHFGFTVEAVVSAARRQVQGAASVSR